MDAGFVDTLEMLGNVNNFHHTLNLVNEQSVVNNAYLKAMNNGTDMTNDVGE